MEKIITYRYIFKYKDANGVSVAVHNMSEAQHSAFIQTILKDDDIISCVREYMHEYDMNQMFYVDKIKQEEFDKNEKNS